MCIYNIRLYFIDLFDVKKIDYQKQLAVFDSIIGLDYENSKPLLDRIQIFNALYDKGHVIHYWPARGNYRVVDWLQLTLLHLLTLIQGYKELCTAQRTTWVT